MKPTMLMVALYVAELSGGDVAGIQAELLKACPDLTACGCGSYVCRGGAPDNPRERVDSVYCGRCGRQRKGVKI